MCVCVCGCVCVCVGVCVCVCVGIPNSSNATPHQEIRLQRSTTLKTNISPGHSCLELICGAAPTEHVYIFLTSPNGLPG